MVLTMRFTDQAAAKPGAIPTINDLYLTDEATLVRELADAADSGEAMRSKIQETASELVRGVRKNKAREGGIDAAAGCTGAIPCRGYQRG